MTSSGEFVKVKQAFRIAYPYVECDIDTQYSQLKILLESELISTSAGLINPVELASTVTGLGTAGYISTAGGLSVLNLASTVTGLGSSGYLSSYSTTVFQSGLTSSLIGLGSLGYISTAGGLSGLDLASTVTGLGTSGYLSSINIASSITGLGSSGYLSSYSTTIFQSNLESTITGLGSSGYLSSINIASSVTGLGSSGYLSSYSTTVFQSNLTSSIQGLGSLGYISSASGLSGIDLASTVTGLGSINYVSSLSLQSTTLVLEEAISTIAASPGVSTLSTIISQGFSSFSTGISENFSSIFSSISFSARLGNVLTVDQINGNDATASPSGLPYKTVNAAISNLVQGDTVWILPGTYVLTNSITLLPNTAMRGMNTQTSKLIMSNVTSNTTMLTMAENSRVEDVSIYLHSQGHYNLVGVNFPGTTNITAKIRPSVITVDNSSAPFSADSSDVYTVYINAINGQSDASFSFNCLKGSTFNLFSNGKGRKRGILVDGAGCTASTRDINVFVRNPTDLTSDGSYVGVETSNATALIQLRTSAISGARKIGAYSCSDILQTLGRIEIGPGTDLINKSAGTSSFTTFVYPTTIFYGVKGSLNIPGKNTTWLWPGTGNAQTASGNQPQYPDSNISYYRIQQSAILYGVTSYLTTAPAGTNSTIVTLQRNDIDIPFKIGYGGTQNGVKHESTLSCDLSIGDLLSVKLSLSGPIGSITAHDLSIQVDIF